MLHHQQQFPAAGREVPEQRGIQKNSDLRNSVQHDAASARGRQPLLLMQDEIGQQVQSLRMI
ncbi:hypothetical protein EFR01_42290 [Sinorhizobium fredii]|nr:hypothetical protein EFR01_42290 [Sinorhizobium fredii]GLS06403.1 hypothetical protein GCM10007864_00270 [Sinorhizobium fredii]